MRYASIIAALAWGALLILTIAKTDALAKEQRILIGDTFNARLLYVIDGDSIMVMKDSQKVEIRLWGIDAPEFDQADSDEARQALEDMALGKHLRLKVKDRDKYGRYVAIVDDGHIVLNEQMIKKGHAWVYTHYCTSSPPCDQWKIFQEAARYEKTGLWGTGEPIPPWRWKMLKRRRR